MIHSREEKILIWAYKKGSKGFTWDELRQQHDLVDFEEEWVRKTFLTASDNDRKFFEHLRNDETTTPNTHYYFLNEKGILAASSILQATSTSVLAVISIILALFSIWLTYASLEATKDTLELTAEPIIGIHFDQNQSSIGADEVSLATELLPGKEGKINLKVTNHSVATVEHLDLKMTIWEVFKKTGEPLTVCPRGYVQQIDESNFVISNLLTSNVLNKNNLSLEQNKSFFFTLDYSQLKNIQLSASSSQILLKMDTTFTKNLNQTQHNFVKLFLLWPEDETIVDIEVYPTAGFGLLDTKEAVGDQLLPRIHPFQQSVFLEFFNVLTPRLDLAPGSCTEFQIQKKQRIIVY